MYTQDPLDIPHVVQNRRQKDKTVWKTNMRCIFKKRAERRRNKSLLNVIALYIYLYFGDSEVLVFCKPLKNRTQNRMECWPSLCVLWGKGIQQRSSIKIAGMFVHLICIVVHGHSEPVAGIISVLKNFKICWFCNLNLKCKNVIACRLWLQMMIIHTIAGIWKTMVISSIIKYGLEDSQYS